MIDLHCHILPGIDDGAPDPGVSLEMARAAVLTGVRTIVATPHVNNDYDPSPDAIARAVGELNVQLSRAEVPLAVLAGAEIAVTRLAEIADNRLRQLTLGASAAVLVESPYMPMEQAFEELLFGLQLRGFRPLLAHPERSPLFRKDVDRLAALVERGVLCSISASSLEGRFGSGAERFAAELIERGLVHNLSSDAHDASRHRALGAGLESARGSLPGVSEHAVWFVDSVPSAVLADSVLPDRPRVSVRRSSLWRRLVGQP